MCLSRVDATGRACRIEVPAQELWNEEGEFFFQRMWPAIILLWLSLFWTLVCLLFYRDRTIVLETSLPAWIVAFLLWLILWSPVSVFKIGRRGGGKPAHARKKKSSSAARKTDGGRPRTTGGK